MNQNHDNVKKDRVYHKQDNKNCSGGTKKVTFAILLGLLAGVLILGAILAVRNITEKKQEEAANQQLEIQNLKDEIDRLKNTQQTLPTPVPDITEQTIPTAVPVITEATETVHVHDWIPATYDQPKTCRTCGLTEGVPLEKPANESGNKLAVGNYHSVLLKKDGTVAAYGSTQPSKYDNRSDRCDVWDWEDIEAISASSHTVGLRSDGTVIAVGVNRYGQCNVDDWRDIKDIDAGDNHTVGLREDGTVVAVGDNSCGQCDVYGWHDIIDVAASAETTYGLTKEGRVLSAGDKNYGSSWRNIKKIDASAYFVVGLKEDGTVVQMGGCNSWEEDTTPQWTNIVDISAGSTFTLGLRKDGSVVSSGSEKRDYSRRDVSDWHDIVAIGAGMYHSVGIQKDGYIVTTGDNSFGQCEIENDVAD